MYSDCTDDNRCEGCSRCTCTAAGTWSCVTVTDGCQELQEEDKEVIDEELIDSALDEMLTELQPAESSTKTQIEYVPKPSPPPEKVLVRKHGGVKAWDDLEESAKEEEEIVLEDIRLKRSVEEKDVEKKNENNTIIFHHTVDEMNEDTLKNTNASGTLPAAKVEVIPVVSRRSSPLNNASKSLQIEYTPPLLNQHTADNKVDSTALHDDQLDLLVHHKIYEIAGNKSQATRDKELSKFVVNELKGGVSETIGDKDAPAISNITFTPENDTLTAMAFIAGNLLNKLWNIEKDTEDSLETENIKHTKINDLLELFKEPLNLRQETFLKNALQQLSTAIENKNVENVSICEKIQEFKQKASTTDIPNVITKPDSYIPSETDLQTNKKSAASKALDKIGNILQLIKKYEQTQDTLNNMKKDKKLNSTTRKSLVNKEKADLSKDEKTTLNVFGNLLESLTKLIVPDKKAKKILKGVKGKTLFTNDKEAKSKLPNLNLTDISLTTKDKLVLDYLTHIQNNPNCLLNKHREKAMLPDIEGDILLNLSEFFKIKSMSDLLKLINTENKKEAPIKRTETTTLDVISSDDFYTTDETTTTKTTIGNKKNNKNQFESTKGKLKKHLKTILEDLIELQNISGKSTNTKHIEIAEVLPCIYNLINGKKLNSFETTTTFNTNQPTRKDHIRKVTDIVNNLKKELKQTTKTRRTNTEFGIRPKSAIVWERTVKNIAKKIKPRTRRNLQSDLPKSFDDVKSITNKIENAGSNTYKSIAYLIGVPPAEQLLLLKTLALDTNKYISVLNEIIQSIKETTTLLPDQHKFVSEFLDNVDINLNLNEKVINGLVKFKQDLSKKEVLHQSSVYNTEVIEEESSGYSTVKLNRDQIINQLIKNRIMYYLKMKEDLRDPKDQINVNLAGKIILYLEMGNDKLARELFKNFISLTKRNIVNSSSNPKSDFVKYNTELRSIKRRTPQTLEPLIQFEELEETSGRRLHQDQLLKQLLNIKNIRV